MQKRKKGGEKEEIRKKQRGGRKMIIPMVCFASVTVPTNPVQEGLAQ